MFKLIKVRFNINMLFHKNYIYIYIYIYVCVYIYISYNFDIFSSSILSLSSCMGLRKRTIRPVLDFKL